MNVDFFFFIFLMTTTNGQKHDKIFQRLINIPEDNVSINEMFSGQTFHRLFQFYQLS